MLNASIQDEYRSHATYAGVLVNFPDQKPFSNIVEAEAQHISAVSQLFDVRGLSVPGSQYATGDIAGFSTVTAACSASVVSETASYQMYDEFLKLLGAAPADVVNVFTNLRNASRDKHLPAFSTCER